LGDVKQLKGLISFLAKQDLNYPRYDDWVQKTEYELDSGYKKAILAFSEGKLVGNLIYQKHKEIPEFLELKNLRIHPDFRMRDFGRFMLKQAEVENSGKYDAIICDCHSEQSEIIRFLQSCNYIPIKSIPLYDKNTLEVVLTKFMKKDNLLLPKVNGFIKEKAL
jgi:ribosomal protein S18 acetylase RimI-like enzyme